MHRRGATIARRRRTRSSREQHTEHTTRRSSPRRCSSVNPDTSSTQLPAPIAPSSSKHRSGRPAPIAIAVGTHHPSGLHQRAPLAFAEAATTGPSAAPAGRSAARRLSSSQRPPTPPAPGRAGERPRAPATRLKHPPAQSSAGEAAQQACSIATHSTRMHPAGRVPERGASLAASGDCDTAREWLGEVRPGRRIAATERTTVRASTSVWPASPGRGGARRPLPSRRAVLRPRPLHRHVRSRHELLRRPGNQRQRGAPDGTGLTITPLTETKPATTTSEESATVATTSAASTADCPANTNVITGVAGSDRRPTRPPVGQWHRVTVGATRSRRRHERRRDRTPRPRARDEGHGIDHEEDAPRNGETTKQGCDQTSAPALRR